MEYPPPGLKIDAGDVHVTDGLVTIEWNIKGFKSLMQQKPFPSVASPAFQMRDATWCLRLGVEFCKTPSDFPVLFLWKQQPERKRRSITCKLKIQVNNTTICEGVRKTTAVSESGFAFIGDAGSQTYLKRCMTSDHLTVVCTVYLEVEDRKSSEANSKDCVKDETHSTRSGQVTCIGQRHGDQRASNSTKNYEGIDILVSQMKDLFPNEENCDFIIKVKDTDFHVHKAILAARSPVLSAMLHHDMEEKNSGTTNIDDCEPDAFERFLFYLYSGQVEELSWSYATHLYTLGDKYDVPHLRKECLQFMEGNMCVEAFYDAISLAVNHNETTLVQCAQEFFVKNVKSILITKNWQLLMIEHPVICNELFLKCYK